MLFDTDGLHPLGDRNPRFIVGYLGDTKVSKPRASLRDNDPFGVSNNAQITLVNLRHEQWRAVAKDVVVVGPAARVDQIQVIVVRQPMLLRVVVAQIRAIVEQPFLGLVEM